MSLHRKNNPKASQGGLTPPTLYDSGLDFPNRGRKTRKRRQVRISCINVTNGLSSVVFISHPNQLHICHCCKNVCQVWQKCFTESVAKMSLWQECHTSRFVESQGFFHEMQNILFFEYKQALMQEITYIQEIECVQPLRFRTPAWENDPSVGNSPVGISWATLGIKSA